MPLLSRGFNVLLTGQDGPHLESIKDSCHTSHPTREIELISIEPAHQERIYDDVLAATIRRNVTLAIICLSPPSDAGSSDDQKYDSVESTGEKLRFDSYGELQRTVLPPLLKRRPCAIITVGSPVPLYSVERETRGIYYEIFSSCFSKEMKTLGYNDVEGVYMECHSVSTGTDGQPPIGFFTPSSSAFAKSVMNAIGCGSSHVFPYWTHELLFLIYYCLWIWPRSVFQWIVLTIL